MNTGKLRKAIALFMVAAMTITAGANTAYAYADSDTTSGSSYVIYNTEAELDNQLRSKYSGSGYKDYKFISTSRSDVLNTYNYSQSSLNCYYNKYNTDNVYSEDIFGTCAEVASMIVMNYYHRYTVVKTSSDANSLFARTMKCAKGHYEVGEGTMPSEIDSIVTKTLDSYGVEDRSGNQDKLGLENTIKDYFSRGLPVIINLSTHSVNSAGYFTKKISYKKKNFFGFYVSYTKTFTYLLINDGWKNCRNDSTDNDIFDVNFYNRYSLVSMDDVESLVKIVID